MTPDPSPPVWMEVGVAAGVGFPFEQASELYPVTFVHAVDFGVRTPGARLALSVELSGFAFLHDVAPEDRLGRWPRIVAVSLHGTLGGRVLRVGPTLGMAFSGPEVGLRAEVRLVELPDGAAEVTFGPGIIGGPPAIPDGEWVWIATMPIRVEFPVTRGAR